MVLKQKRGQLETERKKPDPMRQEPVLKRDIDRLIAQAAPKVQTLLPVPACHTEPAASRSTAYDSASDHCSALPTSA